MRLLENVTLVCVDCVYHGAAYASLKKSLSQIKPARTIFFTDIDVVTEPEIELIKIDRLKSKDEYSHFMIKELYRYINTPYVLVTQHDAWVLDGMAWKDVFYDYDYIGAAWLYVDGRNCGNGGFSLRSKKLLDILGTDEKISITCPEDEIIGRLYRHYLEDNYEIKFPSDDICDQFAFELRTPIYNTFGFHGNFHKPFQKTVCIKRYAALGDVVMVEPVLEYFHKKEYRVILDTYPQFQLLFLNHYFKVHRPDEIDGRLYEHIITFNLDMAYEAKPDQLHLKSYYDFCGITDGEIRNPKLSVGFPIQKNTKLFKKYCILHIDERPQKSRDIRGVNWGNVVAFIKENGYDVIQLGKGDHEEINGALHMTTTNENMLCYVVASADLFIGIDSGISHIASAFNIPSVIFSGSVDLRVIHPDLSNKVWIHNHDKKVCDKPFCWHSGVSTTGHPCYIDNDNPPCSIFTTEQAIDGIRKLIDNESV